MPKTLQTLQARYDGCRDMYTVQI